MPIDTRIPANKRPGVMPGKAEGPHKKPFDSSTAYADFSKSTGADKRGSHPSGTKATGNTK